MFCEENSIPIPEEWRVSDAFIAEAYEKTPPPVRGMIKSALALVHAVYKEEPAQTEESFCSAGAGLRFVQQAKPAPWVILAIAPDYVATHLAAAIMPVHLAGVSTIFALTPFPVSNLLSATLEIAGIEDVFGIPTSATPAAELARIAEKLRSMYPTPGRILYAGKSQIFAPSIPWCPVWQERPASQTGAALKLDTKMQGLWLHADLTPAFFRNTETVISLWSDA